MSTSPRVSVVVPAYNAEGTLGETLSSVLRGQEVDLEVLVVDDGSTDGTAGVADAFGEPVRCARVANGGVASARNHALERARGELVAFCDADDRWLPGKLAAQVALLDAQPECGLVTCGYRPVAPDGTPLTRSPGVVPRPEPRSVWVFEDLLLEGNFVATLTVVLRAEILREVGGFDTSLRTSEDYDLWLRVARRSAFGHVPGIFAEYTVSPGSLSHVHVEPVYAATREVVVRHAQSLGASPSVVRRRLAEIDLEEGWEHLNRGHGRAARTPLFRSLKAKPSIRTAAYLGAALLGVGRSRRSAGPAARSTEAG